MDSGGLFPRTRSLEEDNQTGSDLQSTTMRGRLGHTPLLRHDMCGAECSTEKADGLRMVWTSTSINFPNLHSGFSSLHYEQLPELSCFDPVEVVVGSPNVETNKPINFSKEFQWLFPAKKENCSSFLTNTISDFLHELLFVKGIQP